MIAGRSGAWLCAGFAACCAVARAGEVIVPGDVAVRLTAAPSSGLYPGETISFTLSVTNLGPAPVPQLSVWSSAIHDEFTLADGTSDCGLITSVVDGPSDFWFYRTWYVTSKVPGDPPPLAVGETRICHFTESLTASAPAVTAYSFGMLDKYVDPNPVNNTATVELRRAVPATSVPTLSSRMLLLLAGMLGCAAFVAARRWLA